MKHLTLAVLMILIAGMAMSQSGDQTVNFKVRTSSPGGNFSPRNIGAIWVEDSSGHFVKTLKRWADRRKQYLYTWNTKSGGNVTDAITGATLSSHGTHNVTWDCTNTSGTVVPDGQYSLRVEMTDQHSQGPLLTVNFSIGGTTDTLLSADAANFHDIQLIYTNNTITSIINNDQSTSQYFELRPNYPNPFNPQTTIEYTLSSEQYVTVSVYDLSGRLVDIVSEGSEYAGIHHLNWSPSNLPGGIYLYSVKAGSRTLTGKMIYLK